MGKYIGHRLVARPELDNTFWTDSTSLLLTMLRDYTIYPGKKTLRWTAIFQIQNVCANEIAHRCQIR